MLFGAKLTSSHYRSLSLPPHLTVPCYPLTTPTTVSQPTRPNLSLFMCLGCSLKRAPRHTSPWILSRTNARWNETLPLFLRDCMSGGVGGSGNGGSEWPCFPQVAVMWKMVFSTLHFVSETVYVNLWFAFAFNITFRLFLIVFLLNLEYYISF